MCFFFFFFNDPATTEIYTLSLHDALPIFWQGDRELKGEPMDAVQARAIYEEIVRRKRDPALIELAGQDRKSTRLNSSHSQISYAVFCLKKKKKEYNNQPVKPTPIHRSPNI